MALHGGGGGPCCCCMLACPVSFQMLVIGGWAAWVWANPAGLMETLLLTERSRALFFGMELRFKIQQKGNALLRSSGAP